jgi:uncharacterized protein GlcG (DUF336 family)
MKILATAFLSIFIFSSAFADEEEIEVVYSVKNLTMEAALIIAQESIKSCREKGASVSVAVLDNAGNTQVVLRDRLAGFSTVEGAILKAKTAVNFRSGTQAFTESIYADPKSSGIKFLPGVILLGGGLPIEASGSLLGAVGVAGAPGGEIDEQCAQAGIDAIIEALEFAE